MHQNEIGAWSSLSDSVVCKVKSWLSQIRTKSALMVRNDHFLPHLSQLTPNFGTRITPFRSRGGHRRSNHGIES